MITANQIQELNDIFVARDAKLFHACQYVDFCSYIALGGIPSRNLLEKQGLPFTRFDTDRRDHDNYVWDKVFVNLHDFGGTFALGRGAVPNTFGPILFVMRPDTFSYASDVAICMRSAGALHFDREAEGISINQVESLFANPIAAGSPEKSYIKYARDLCQIFPDAHEPEVSCTIADQLIPLDHVAYIKVDPYIINGTALTTHVHQCLAESGVRIPIHDRTAHVSRSNMYDDFLPLISSNAFATIDAFLAANISTEMRNWAESIRRIWYQVPRFANYLQAGTIIPLTTP